MIFASGRQSRGFTIIELMVAVIVFTFGLLAAYALIRSASSVSVQSRDEILWGNILREQMELLKNLRDSNWLRLQNWDRINENAVVKEGTGFTPCSYDTTASCLSPGYYTIENSYDSPGRPIRLFRLPESFDPTKVSTFANEMKGWTPPQTRLCLDENRRYSHKSCVFSESQKTPFFSYIRLEPYYRDNAWTPEVLTWAFAVSSYFASMDAGYHSYDMHTIITDWKR